MSERVNIKDKIEAAAGRFDLNYKKQEIFEVSIGEKLPKEADIIDLLHETRKVVFPGFFGDENSAYVNLNNFAGNTLAVIYEKLYRQIRTVFLFRGKRNRSDDFDLEMENIALSFIDRLPDIQELILKDVEAELKGDPAATSKEEIIFSYPGIFAIFVYRVAHELYKLNLFF